MQTISQKRPAITTTDLRSNDLRYPSLPNIMNKKKPIYAKTPTDLGVDVGTVQRSGGSSRLRQLWAWRGDWIEHTTEPGAEHAVVDRAADLKKQIGASPRPSHLLRFIHSPVDQEIRGARTKPG